MSLFEKLLAGEEKLSLVGLGYVGMPIAVAYAKKIKVVGYDFNAAKVELYKKGVDPTREVGDEAIKNTSVEFTADPEKLRECKFHVVAVPTPVNDDHTPDLSPVEGASHTLGKYLTKGSIVVYESTVYPGVTEDICVPILEQESGLKCGVDFKVGYSPERINPGDKVHRLDTITKIVSGMDEETLEEVANVYSLVALAGVYKAQSIKVAEAAKVIENSQRDINIAFMNELSMIFHKMDIDTKSVLEAAGTKWNFLKFFPGLVGGHCIGVDPYYLTYKAEELGYEIRFFSHPVLMPYVDRMRFDSRVRVLKGNVSYREIFAQSALITTDYSSVFFDFAYLKKPVVYTQFKENHYEAGYFDYERDGFGEVVRDLDSAVELLIGYMENGCQLKKEYEDRIDAFYAYHDRNNCERVCREILDYDKRHER